MSSLIRLFGTKREQQRSAPPCMNTLVYTGQSSRAALNAFQKIPAKNASCCCCCSGPGLWVETGSRFFWVEQRGPSEWKTTELKYSIISRIIFTVSGQNLLLGFACGMSGASSCRMDAGCSLQSDKALKSAGCVSTEMYVCVGEDSVVLIIAAQSD